MSALTEDVHTCSVTSWRRFYRLPVMWLLDKLNGTGIGIRCRTCGAEVKWWI